MAKKNEEGLRQHEYAKGDYLPMESDDLTAVINLGIQALKRGARPKYRESEDGYQAFVECSQEYLDYVKQINDNPAIEKKLVIDIESWCVYVGITRETLRQYEARGGAWKEFIAYFKEIIVMCKKQLAFNYKIPPMFATFDLVNNHNYRNTNEFHVMADIPKKERTITAEELIETAKLLPKNDGTGKG